MTIDSIINYIQVSKRIATSGQPEERHFKSIAQARYKVVINLGMPNSDNALLNEGNIVTACNMTYVHIPVPFEAPAIEHLRQFFSIMNAYADQKVWIHCVANYRVSAFLYQYKRLVLCESHKVASKVMLPSWQPNSIWKHFMNYSLHDLYAWQGVKV